MITMLKSRTGNRCRLQKNGTPLINPMRSGGSPDRCQTSSHVGDHKDKEYHDEIVILEFLSGDQLISYYNIRQDIDIVFLDIIMDGCNGVEVAEKIRNKDKKINIIFLTSVDQYVYEGYRLKANDYIIKSSSYRRVRETFERIMNDIVDYEKHFILEKNDGGLFKIYYQEIVYIETYGRKTRIITNSGSIVSYKTMKQHMEELDNSFYRCHESFIVNMLYIKKD